MYILVDYDNIQKSVRRNGVEFVVEKILRVFDSSALAQKKRINIRFYGGWYDGVDLTRQAQQLVVEIGALQSHIFYTSLFGQQKKLPVHIEMAYSLAVAPSKLLPATFRPGRPALEKIKSHHPSKFGCIEDGCPMLLVYQYISSGECPEKNCKKPMGRLFYTDEQKLVDTMLSVDLLHYAVRQSEDIALVSSDDDFWPSIISLLTSGAKLTHILTSGNSAYSRNYLSGLSDNYTALEM